MALFVDLEVPFPETEVDFVSKSIARVSASTDSRRPRRTSMSMSITPAASAGKMPISTARR
jgi:hypothetical protein